MPLDLVSSSFIMKYIHSTSNARGAYIAYFCTRLPSEVCTHNTTHIQGVLLLSMIWYTDLDACFCHLLSSIINKRCSVFCCYLLFFFLSILSQPTFINCSTHNYLLMFQRPETMSGKGMHTERIINTCTDT